MLLLPRNHNGNLFIIIREIPTWEPEHSAKTILCRTVVHHGENLGETKCLPWRKLIGCGRRHEKQIEGLSVWTPFGQVWKHVRTLYVPDGEIHMQYKTRVERWAPNSGEWLSVKRKGMYMRGGGGAPCFHSCFHPKYVKCENLTELSRDCVGLFYFNLCTFSVPSVWPKNSFLKGKHRLMKRSPKKRQRCVPRTLHGNAISF